MPPPSAGETSVVHNHSTTTNTTNSNNNTTTNNHTNITNNNNQPTTINININPYNREDLSHITYVQWQSLVRMGQGNNMHRVISALVALVNYNPSKPENMNLYMSPSVKDSPEDALVFQRQTGDPTPRWRRVKAETAVAWLMSDRTSNIFEWTDANESKVPTAESKVVEDFFNSINSGGQDSTTLAELIHRAATFGSEVMLVLRGGNAPVPGSVS